MKKLILICGANGVGKSTAGAELLKRLPASAYVESEYCRMMNPFEFTDETAGVITDNILSMIWNYFNCSAVRHVILTYGFHGRRKQIFEKVIAELRRKTEFEFCPVILTCSEDENIRRMEGDGRDSERIERALRNTRGIYDAYDYPRLDTTVLTAGEMADGIIKILNFITRYFITRYFITRYFITRYFITRYFITRYFITRYFITRYFITRYFITRYFITRYFITRYFITRYFITRYFITRYFITRYFITRYFITRYFITRYFITRYFITRYFITRYFITRYFITRYLRRNTK